MRVTVLFSNYIAQLDSIHITIKRFLCDEIFNANHVCALRERGKADVCPFHHRCSTPIANHIILFFTPEGTPAPESGFEDGSKFNNVPRVKGTSCAVYD
jgi:hypothetical protein